MLKLHEASQVAIHSKAEKALPLCTIGQPSNPSLTEGIKIKHVMPFLQDFTLILIEEKLPNTQ